MDKSWDKFEDKVRGLAQHIWGKPCLPTKIGGVNIDGAIAIDSEVSIHVEITEDRTLAKVRTDITKLITAKADSYSRGVLAKSFCVVNGPITNSMKEAGASHHIQVLSISEFSRLFFDFDRYSVARQSAPFGSSVDPLTGESDETAYVPVRYTIDGRVSDVTSHEIARWLKEGSRIILLGEYGSLKSRCIREVFRLLSTHAVETLAYPVAINLRQSWGLSRSSELLRRHLQDLGLDDLEGAAIRAFKSGSVALMLDGFDEVGSQAWSNDGQKLKIIRAKSLQGVKNIITESKGGVLITGREHYFPNSAEMFSALGLDPKKTIVSRSKNEFSDTELLEYFSQLDMEVDIPSWLPRRPLICQTIANLDAETFNTMFGSEGNEVDFWNHFIRVICERDARIHVSFDSDTIFAIFVQLARLTRTKAANVGPISLNELQSAFEAVTGAAPIEEASLMLQRLPSLGRVSAETNDRQFVDVYILDGLRAKDAARICIGTEIEIAAVSGAKWHNALDDLGQRVLALDSTSTAKLRLSLAERFSQLGNMVLASDLVSSLSRETDGSSMDFSGLKIDHGDFLYFPLFERELRNLTVTNSYIGELALPAKKATNVTLANCATPKVSGIASAAGLPQWISSLDAEQFDSVESISRIRKIGLQPSHEILITIIRKTFFQKGSGRKEEALLRGLGMVGTKNLSKKILSAMITEGLLTSFKGDEGNVYAPVRAHAPRMQTILDELKSSKDPLWLAIAKY